MSTGQTMLTIGAFILLSNILVTFYRLLGESGQTIDDAQAGLTAITLATSYQEVSQGLPFDEATIDTFLTTSQISLLTAPLSLGPDNPPPSGQLVEDQISNFDDFDDFNNFTLIDSTLGGALGKYKTHFAVYYVLPTDINTKSSTRTFVKRMDMRIWRILPPSTDTLKTSIVVGYFHFN